MDLWFHSVSLISEKCKGCTNCIKHCPTEAIRVRDGKARINSERCIDCGECIRFCENHAKQAVEDSLESLLPYQYTIALPAPTLLGQFKDGVTPAQILGALKAIGFDKVFETGLGADYTTIALRQFLKTARPHLPYISSACPSVVRLIQVRFPGLINHLVPVEAPMMTAAKLAREEAVKETGLHPGKIGVFFITPCPAKITDIKSSSLLNGDLINGAVSITQIYGQMQQIILNGKYDLIEPQNSPVGLGWSKAGGENAAIQGENQLWVDGIHNVVNLLEAIEMGKLDEVNYIEALACSGGCIGGALTVENPFVARLKIQKLIQSQKLPDVSTDTVQKAEGYFKEHFFDTNLNVTPKPMLQLDQDLGQAIQKMELLEATAKSLPGLDCGSCGSPTCRALAEDVVLGKAQVFDCVFKLREEVSNLAQELLQLSQKLPPAMGINEKKDDRK